MIYLIPYYFFGFEILGALAGFGIIAFIIAKLVPIFCYIVGIILFYGFAKTAFPNFIKATLGYAGIIAVIVGAALGCLYGLDYFSGYKTLMFILFIVLLIGLCILSLMVTISYLVILHSEIFGETDKRFILITVILCAVFFIADFIIADNFLVAYEEFSVIFTSCLLTIPLLLLTIFRHWNLRTTIGMIMCILLSASLKAYYFITSTDYYEAKNFGISAAISFGILLIPSLIPGIINSVKNKKLES